MGIYSRFNKSPLVYLFLMALQFLQHTCFAGAGEIRVHPNSTHVPLREWASFECVIVGEDAVWFINRQTIFSHLIPEFENKGFRFNETIMQSTSDDRRHVHYLSLRFQATLERNNTKIACGALQDISTQSNTANLTVMGASSPPAPRLRLIDTTLVKLEWDTPFTWDGYPIDHYDVSVVGRQEWYEPEYTNTLIDFITEPGDIQECEELTFKVKANNGLADSEPGVISGGFPKVPELADEPISEFLTFSPSLVPSVRFDIQLPYVCDYQDVEYTISLRREDTKELVVNEVSSVQRYGEAQSVQYEVEEDLELDVDYTVTVVFSAIVESEEISLPLQVHKSFHISVLKSPTIGTPRGVDQASNDGPLSTQVIIIISIVGGALVIILILVIAIIFMAAMRRRRTVVVENVDCGTPDHKRNGSLKRPPMVTNPIYEGPVYESIDPQLNRLNSSTPSTPTALLLPSPYANTAVDPTYIFPNNNLPNEDNYTIMSAAAGVAKTVDDEEMNNESNLDRDPSAMRYAPDPSGGTTIISEC